MGGEEGGPGHGRRYVEVQAGVLACLSHIFPDSAENVVVSSGPILLGLSSAVQWSSVSRFEPRLAILRVL